MSTFKKKATTFSNWFTKATRALALVASFFLFVLLLYSTADVVGRYLFNRPMFATYELTETFLVIIVFFAIAYVQNRKMHIRLEVLSYLVSPRGWNILSLLTYATGLFIYVLIIWQGLGWSWDSFVTKSVMQGSYPIPHWPPQFALLIGAIIFCIQYIIDIIQTIPQILKPGKGEEKEIILGQ